MENKLAGCYSKSNSNPCIVPTRARCYVSGMDVKQTRDRNFNTLLKLYKNNRVFADTVGLASGHVSQIKTRVRNVGDEVARRIEQKLRLPHGWMDQSHDTEDPPVVADEPARYQILEPSEEKEWLDLIKALTPRQRDQQKAAIRLLVTENQEVLNYVGYGQHADILK